MEDTIKNAPTAALVHLFFMRRFMDGRILSGIGPQRGPSPVGRLRAKWRQVDVENRESITVRQQWMALIGFAESEISEACDNAYDLSLEEELEQLGAAIRLAR